MSAGDATETSPLLNNEAQDLERHEPIDASRAAQFAGNSEVQQQFRIIIPALATGVLLIAADQTIVATCLQNIGSDLSALNLTSWVATSYLLSLASFQPLYGKLSDIFGRKPCLLFSYAAFGTGCLLCGLSQNIYQLIAFRAWQGVGGGMTTVLSILLSDVVPLKDRGMWQGYINIVYSTGSAIGAPMGGLLADTIGWRWAFIAQFPLCLIGFIAILVVLKLPTKEEDTSGKFKRIDFMGAFLLVFAVVSLVFGMDRGSNVAWSAPISYAPIAASVVLFAMFLYVETRVAAEPFAPGRIIFKGSMFAGYICMFASSGSFLSIIYFTPLFYQAVDGNTATASALKIIPAVVASVCGSLFGGFMIKRTGRLYWITIAGYVMLPVGALSIFLFSGTVSNSVLMISVGLVISAFGSGIGITTVLIALISDAAPEDQAVTTACTYLFRQLGAVIGISLSASFIQQQLRKSLKEALGSGKDAAKIEKRVRRSLKYLRKLPLEKQQIIRAAYGNALRHGFALMIAIAVGATIACIFLKEKRLSR